MQNLKIDGERLWGELMETAQIGGTPKGGICRLTLTDLDRQVREWFKARCEALGCTVTGNAMGAMFARARGPWRARGSAPPGAGRLRDLRPDRSDQLDQRGGLALCARHGRVRRVC